MSIIDSIVKHIIEDTITPLEVDETGQVQLDADRIDAPSIDDFLNPDPCLLDEDDNGSWRPATSSPETVLILGRYYPMQSPGQVVLYQKNLKLFFLSVLREVDKRVQYYEKPDLERMARLIVLKTYYHELFHFDCDMLRHLFGSVKDKLKEEALAVAWSRRRIMQDRDVWNNPIGRMNGLVYRVVMQLIYAYRSPGYRDWQNYGDDVRFKTGLLSYHQPSNSAFLEASGVPVDKLIFDMLGKRKEGEGFKELAI